MSGILSTRDCFAFIQARLGSTRFPKKILKSIPEESNTSVLDHIHNRLSTIFPKEQIVFLVPEGDRELIEFLQNKNYQYFVGSESDVRDRFRKACLHFKAKHIFRLTGDNPFIDLESIRYLYEAITYISDPYYSLSMVGLPLGMGVECFSANSLLLDAKGPIPERHTEHVSLHIKEHPEIHKQIRLSAPHLNHFVDINPSTLRITVDESKDYELVCSLWEKLGTKDPFFGAKEVIQLAKDQPEFFLVNASVEQVTFPLPKEGRKSKQVRIVYGEPSLFGSGHYERCKSLSVFLEMNGYDIILSDKPDLESRDLPQILDIRENEFPLHNLFYIDNLHHLPNKSNSSFFLPNPMIPIHQGDPISYFNSPLSELDWNQKTIPGQVLVYAGSLGKEESELIDRYLLQFLNSNTAETIVNIDSVVRIGGTPPINQNVNFISRISYIEFLKQIQKSELVLTYFGQTMMESIGYGKKVCLIGITPIHESLGKFAEEKLGIPYLGSLSELKDYKQFPNLFPNPKTKLVRDAHLKILKWLESIYES
ncbi:spore coat biosynthesis protein F [Leptospira sp. 2 VSF19]|uniref:Spore coat biosynthesis protein F n=1 Tax=Leptospira soteropolitanensis TaxID=2950025 RepID=A0AAW5VDV7_9LEPT|nr:spore coat biosynthesis protein F [Leptospira soteropolitanensis]MCW7491734.1 spore coat biosynthesis protein F [Leptospira soteropolitanensis]MCW7499319.1 spore coat biosynthesis protein F [Leptospira soteropolitanensis]MCW7521090.1 spore coat biosynthesis protein F [Leptospira soteropolitanensis]MCW7525422.1 spore coat biosynthesis protein F [Leptospira soteropolitanensis]MCW7529289.1 spore coat biosynthesis protein F [Leptospira soteropolitanensis]